MAATATAAAVNGMAVDRVVFALNGQRYEVAGVDPSTRLLEFIRTQLGCGEGTYVYLK
jgi:abscisic-aldehyde oxidase